MKDSILEKFFEQDRWQEAISRGVDKDIRKDVLIKLTTPQMRARLYTAIRDGRYRISPPHTARIPKDKPGEYRTVYINEPLDRIVLSIANDLLFELMPETIHPRCKSYIKGTGCGRTVQEISRIITQSGDGVIGWRSDLSKYFDSVPLHYIDLAFDNVEARHGRSALIDVLRQYYHSDLYFDEQKNLTSRFQSLKQGCAVAAYLADAILHHIDEKLSSMKGHYTRYSDDMLYIGPDSEEAMHVLETELERMEMRLNPAKVEQITGDRWFKFLGFSIKGSDISLSSTRIKKFQKEIESRTTRNRKTTPARAVNAVNRFLYKGDGRHSWATQILPVCTVRKDIDTLNAFVMDCLRAVATGKRKTGGLGYIDGMKEGCIARGTGRNVKANRQKTPQKIEGYLTIGCMYNALRTRKAVYNTLVASL